MLLSSFEARYRARSCRYSLDLTEQRQAYLGLHIATRIRNLAHLSSAPVRRREFNRSSIPATCQPVSQYLTLPHANVHDENSKGGRGCKRLRQGAVRRKQTVDGDEGGKQSRQHRGDHAVVIVKLIRTHRRKCNHSPGALPFISRPGALVVPPDPFHPFLAICYASLA